METLNLTPARITVASIIRKAILAGEFTSGQELSLTEIAAQLGVSRTPVREAFQSLESDGLIKLRMNKCAIVLPINEEFIRNHYDIRMLLEGEAVAKAIEHGLDPHPLEDLQANISTRQVSELDKAYVDYNLAFHTYIWAGAKNQKLYSFLESLWNGPSFSRAVTEDEHRALSTVEHEEIAQYIRQGLKEQGRQAMARHIQRSMSNILNGFKMK